MSAKEWVTHHRATAAILLVSIIAIVGFALTWRHIEAKTTVTPYMTVEQPIQVKDRVPGVKGPAIYDNATDLTTDVHQCFQGAEHLSVTYRIIYIRVAPDGRVSETVPDGTGALTADKGCFDGAFLTHEVPPILSPGLWKQVSNLNVAPTRPAQDSLAQSYVVETTPFQVVANPTLPDVG